MPVVACAFCTVPAVALESSRQPEATVGVAQSCVQRCVLRLKVRSYTPTRSDPQPVFSSVKSLHLRSCVWILCHNGILIIMVSYAGKLLFRSPAFVDAWFGVPPVSPPWHSCLHSLSITISLRTRRETRLLFTIRTISVSNQLILAGILEVIPPRVTDSYVNN